MEAEGKQRKKEQEHREFHIEECYGVQINAHGWLTYG